MMICFDPISSTFHPVGFQFGLALGNDLLKNRMKMRKEIA